MFVNHLRRILDALQGVHKFIDDGVVKVANGGIDCMNGKAQNVLFAPSCSRLFACTATLVTGSTNRCCGR